jgi:membrane protease YdiL (CAAX protease family)
MTLLINQTLQAIMTILLVFLIPLSCHFIKKRTFSGIFDNIGIYMPEKWDPRYSIGLILTVFSISSIFNVITGNFTISITEDATGVNLVIILILYGLQTGISQEILFRGFFAKRLIKEYGFKYGNIMQSFIYCIPQIFINNAQNGIELLLGIITTFFVGYVFGYIMKNKCQGSIIPIMIAHILMNIVSGIMMYLVL